MSMKAVFQRIRGWGSIPTSHPDRPHSFLKRSTRYGTTEQRPLGSAAVIGWDRQLVAVNHRIAV